MSRTPRTPKYRQIAEDLRAEILSGMLAPGAALPGQNKLAEDYGVAPGTARLALVLLQNEGLAVARKGVGVHVRDFRVIIRRANQRLASSQWASGRSIWEADVEDRPMAVDSIRVHKGTAPERVARVLGHTSVWVRERRYLVEDKPVMLATSYLPAELVEGTPITLHDPGAGGIYARLDEIGLKPVRFQEQVHARPAAADEVDRLALAVRGAPVQTIARVAYTADGRAVEVNEQVLDAAVYVLQYDLTP